jgi:hypothetical protein
MEKSSKKQKRKESNLASTPNMELNQSSVPFFKKKKQKISSLALILKPNWSSAQFQEKKTS